MSRPRCTWEAKNEGGEKKLFVIGSWKMLEFKIRLTIWAHSMTAFLCKKKNEPSVTISGEQMNELINPADPFAGRLKQHSMSAAASFRLTMSKAVLWYGEESCIHGCRSECRFIKSARSKACALKTLFLQQKINF